MMRQTRKAMAKEETKEVFEAIVEIDESYIGRKPRKENHHTPNDPDKADTNKRGRGTNKTPVIGIKERSTGKVHAVVANKNKCGKQLTGKQVFSVWKKGYC
jgi:DNA-directed RNA polymerase subunit K/omega